MNRVPPNKPDVERAILATAMSGEESLNAVLAENMNLEMFYSTAHQCIFRAIEALARKDKPVDILTVSDELRRAEELGKAGSESYISEIAENTAGATGSTTTEYCRLIREAFELRTFANIASRANSSCFDPDAEPGAIMEQLEAGLSEIIKGRGGNRPYTAREMLPVAFEEIERSVMNKGSLGLLTGLSKLDEATTGMHPGEVIVIAARPGGGKTAFMLNVIAQNAIRQKKSVLMFTLEMTRIQMMKRILSLTSEISFPRMRDGSLRTNELKRLSEVASPIYDAPFQIDDTAGISPQYLKSRARQLKRKCGLDLIIVDYLQLMTMSRGTQNRQEEVAAISRALKEIAKDLEVPVIALAQLNRNATEEREPELRDLRESGAIEQDADCVVFLHRNDEDQKKDEIQIIIRKQRNGPVCKIRARFIKQFMQFKDLENHGM